MGMIRSWNVKLEIGIELRLKKWIVEAEGGLLQLS